LKAIVALLVKFWDRRHVLPLLTRYFIPRIEQTEHHPPRLRHVRARLFGFVLHRVEDRYRVRLADVTRRPVTQPASGMSHRDLKRKVSQRTWFQVFQLPYEGKSELLPIPVRAVGARILCMLCLCSALFLLCICIWCRYSNVSICYIPVKVAGVFLTL
jgi:hypothetical protein